MISWFPDRTVVVDLFGWSIHWYGLLYVVAFVVALWLLPRLQKYRNLNLTADDWLLVVIASMVGVLVGGRLGYVLLYAPGYFAQHPLEIFALWQGGMASHGGFIGVAVALWYISQKLKVHWRALLDVAVIPAAIGLALGRLGNFINQELYGTATTLPWGVHIPGLVGRYHPVQLYEALWDLTAAAICTWYLVRGKRPNAPQAGQVTALFLMLYGLGRLVISFWRLPDGFIVGLGNGVVLYESQLLTIPVLFLGAWLWHRWYAK